MRSKYDEQLELLNREMIAMGALCEEVISLASRALMEHSTVIASKVKPLDADIDQKEREIESLCLKLLLRQQPVAGDLRTVSAALKMITDMERIGDQAEDIEEIIRFLEPHSQVDTTHIGIMAEATIKMVNDSIDAFVKKDINIADKVIRHDDYVDELFSEVRAALIDMISKDSTKGEYAIDLLMIAKYFERIGDHATNIAEWVIYSVTGIHKEGN